MTELRASSDTPSTRFAIVQALGLTGAIALAAVLDKMGFIETMDAKRMICALMASILLVIANAYPKTVLVSEATGRIIGGAQKRDRRVGWIMALGGLASFVAALASPAHLAVAICSAIAVVSILLAVLFHVAAAKTSQITPSALAIGRLPALTVLLALTWGFALLVIDKLEILDMAYAWMTAGFIVSAGLLLKLQAKSRDRSD
jgi:hypothetical protein